MQSINPIRGHLLKAMLALLPFCTQAQGLRIGTGTHVVITGDPVVVLNNAGIVNNGYFTAGKSNVVFAGNTNAAITISGSKPVTFYNVGIGTTAGDVVLYNNITVEGTIAMNSGNLQLNNYTLDLGSTGNISGERNLSRITGASGGVIKAVTMLYAHKPVNPGNIGVEINSENNLGQTVVTRGHQQQINANGQSGIERYFDIIPANNAPLHANLRFYYLSGELDGNDGNDLSIFSGSAGQRNWTLWGKDKADAVNGWVVKNNAGQSHRFTLAIPLAGAAKQGKSGVAVQLFPNPSRDAFTVLLTSDTEKDGVIYLYDQLGRQLEGKKIHCQPGTNRLQWDIRSYAAGSYYLVFANLGVKNLSLEKQ